MIPRRSSLWIQMQQLCVSPWASDLISLGPSFNFGHSEDDETYLPGL